MFSALRIAMPSRRLFVDDEEYNVGTMVRKAATNRGSTTLSTKIDTCLLHLLTSSRLFDDATNRLQCDRDASPFSGLVHPLSQSEDAAPQRHAGVRWLRRCNHDGAFPADSLARLKALAFRQRSSLIMR